MRRMIGCLLVGSLGLACAPGETSDRGPTILALTADAARGQSLYTDTCEECHLEDGTGENSDENLVRAFAEEDEETLIAVVLNGRRGTRMESFADRSDQDLADVFAYAKSLAGK